MAAAVAVSIARASLRGGLLRPDPTAVPADSIADFHALLNQALTICSPANIQTCKRWILTHIAPSRARTILLGKFLSALAPSLQTAAGVSPRRQRIHILYLLSDILHHTTHHAPSPTFAESILPFLRDLFAATALPGAPKTAAKLQRLLALWGERGGIYPPPVIAELQSAASGLSPTTTSSSSFALTATTDTTSAAAATATKSYALGRPLLLPPFHGDPSLPFYDLPAANMLPHLIPNAPVPINPRLLKPIQFSTLTPNESLAVAVKEFLSSIDHVFPATAGGGGGGGGGGEEEQPDAIGGTRGESYYGWTRGFCEKMKLKKRAAAAAAAGDGKASAAPRSRQSRGGRRHGRGRSYTTSPSPSDRRSFSPSRSRSRSRSPSHSRSRSRRRYRTRSPSSSSFQTQPQLQQQQYTPDLSQQQQHYPQPPQFPPPPPLPPLLAQQMGGYAYPQYPWPPPPPPPPPPPLAGWGQMLQQQQQQQGQGQGGGQQGGGGPYGYGYVQGFHPWGQQGQGGYQYGGVPPPPPPPPPPPQIQGMGMGMGQEGGGEGVDYRVVKGREIGAKRGWKT